jgi:hypothetical protein
VTLKMTLYALLIYVLPLTQPNLPKDNANFAQLIQSAQKQGSLFVIWLMECVTMKLVQLNLHAQYIQLVQKLTMQQKQKHAIAYLAHQLELNVMLLKLYVMMLT